MRASKRRQRRDTEEPRLRALDGEEERRGTPAREAHDALETALFEIKRVIVGQESMLERVIVALLAGGHVLLEGVPGLAKTLTVKTVSDVLGGSFKRLQFTPDLVPADLVGTRIYRPDTGGFDTELGPGVLQLPARRRDQPRAGQGAVGAARGHAGAPGHDRPRDPPRAAAVPRAWPPRTRSSPRAPTRCPRRRSTASCSSSWSTTPTRATRSPSSSARSTRARGCARCSRRRALAAHQRAAAQSYVDRRVMEYAVALTTATRERGEHGWVEFGASPRGSINLIHAGRALALLRARDYVLPVDVRDLARDVLRHRIVLTYEALAAGVDADRVLDDVLAADADAAHRARARAAGRALTTMGFREPLVLLGLACCRWPSLAYVAAQRRRRRFAVRYTNVDLLAARRPARAGCGTSRRCSSCSRSASLLVALARPERTVAAQRKEATVVMVTDTSGSMLAKDVRAGPAGGGARGGPDADAPGARGLPARAGQVRLDRRAGGRADDRPHAAGARAARRSRSRAGQRWATG